MSLRGIVFAVVGLAVIALAANLARVAPSPGALATSHAAVAELAGPTGCERCHGGPDLGAACIRCHEPIGGQLSSGAGLHGSFAADVRTDCAACHGEHYGADYPLVNAVSWGYRDWREFRHPHVAFELVGAHGGSSCEECHRAAPKTFLGLGQECLGCHADVHGETMSDDCAGCHSQEAFRPAAKFEHARRFPLLGAHAEAACARCHPSSSAPAAGAAAAPLDFRNVTGTSCGDCHATPHRAAAPPRAAVGDDCARCHLADDRAFAAASPRLAAAEHARLGFRLDGAHAAVACSGCHGVGASFTERYPGRRERDCAACHVSPHGGQFGARESDCASCHPGATFQSSKITAKNHRPPLRDRHRGVACAKCHPAEPLAGAAAAAAPARFVGTPTACAACHADPHAGQFAKSRPDCASCHDEKGFTPARYDFAKEHVPLRGAHAQIDCKLCHVAPRNEAGVAQAVRFTGTPTKCASCHADVHRGQFGKRGGDCATCHDETRFRPSRLEVAAHRPPLEGAHLAVACSRCHTVATRGESKGTRRFVGTPKQCKSCHEDPHAGQLTARNSDCNRCHVSLEAWLPATFDHRTQSRFVLDGVHARLACEQCHLRERSTDGRERVHYKPLGIECRDCHAAR